MGGSIPDASQNNESINLFFNKRTFATRQNRLNTTHQVDDVDVKHTFTSLLSYFPKYC